MQPSRNGLSSLTSTRHLVSISLSKGHFARARAGEAQQSSPDLGGNGHTYLETGSGDRVTSPGQLHGLFRFGWRYRCLPSKPGGLTLETICPKVSEGLLHVGSR